jgi:hypothetical protein
LASTSAKADNKSVAISIGAIIGTAIGGAALITLLVFLTWCFFFPRGKQLREKTRSRRVVFEMLSPAQKPVELPVRYSQHTLKSAM